MSNKNTTGCLNSHRVFLQSTCTFKVCRLPVSSEDLLDINGQLISASAQQTIGSVQQKDACVSHQDLINVSTDRCMCVSSRPYQCVNRQMHMCLTKTLSMSQQTDSCVSHQDLINVSNRQMQVCLIKTLSMCLVIL